MKKNIIIIVLSVVALLLAGTVGYFISDKIVNKESISNENNIEESINLVFAESIIKKYYASSYYYAGGSLFTNGLTDEVKMLIAFNNVSLKNISSVNCGAYYDESYRSEDGSYYSAPSNDSNGFVGTCDDSSTSIIYSDVNHVYNTLFGSDMPKKDLIIGLDRFDYIEDRDVYIDLNFYGGGIDFSIDFYKVKDVQLNGDQLIINVAHSLFTPSESFDISMYTPDFDSTLKIEIEENINEEFKEEIFEKYLDKMATYKFTFKVENGKYMLKDVSKVEA